MIEYKLDMIKAVFFDLDGTLVDTHRANYEAYKYALSLEGVTIDFNQFKKTIGMQAKEFLPILVPMIDETTMERVALNKSKKYSQLMNLTGINEDMINFLRRIRRSATTALVTTAKRVNALAVLNHYDLADLFDFVITAEDVKKSKPNPEAYLLALRMAGVKASEAIAFEDSQSGKKSAEDAGIAVVIVKEFRL